MTELPNGNRCSKISVTPKTWKEKKAFNKDVDWVVSYRFYLADGKVKQVLTQGMNNRKTWLERKEYTEVLIEALEDDLRKGYNPVTNKMVENGVVSELTPFTTLGDAFMHVLPAYKKSVEAGTYSDTEIVAKFIKNCVDTSDMLLSDVSRKQTLQLMERIEAQKIKLMGEFTNNNYNHFRRSIGYLYTQLETIEAIKQSPITEKLKVRKVVKKIRQVLTPDERTLLKKEVQSKYPDFYNYIYIFFHSGSRHAELFKLKGSDVDLTAQKFKVVLKKGRRTHFEEVQKVIKDIALPTWKKIMANCQPDDFVFSKDMKPGKQEINPAQATRRWNTHIKKKLGITADMYALKHLHTDEVHELEGVKVAQQHNSHSSEKMTETVYAVGASKRRERVLRELDNDF